MPPSPLPTRTEATDGAAQETEGLGQPGAGEEEKGGRGGGGGVMEGAAREAGSGGIAVGGDDLSRYYSKPPDWALSLCVT